MAGMATSDSVKIGFDTQSAAIRCLGLERAAEAGDEKAPRCQLTIYAEFIARACRRCSAYERELRPFSAAASLKPADYLSVAL
jgi:hypothetical protein